MESLLVVMETVFAHCTVKLPLDDTEQAHSISENMHAMF